MMKLNPVQISILSVCLVLNACGSLSPPTSQLDNPDPHTNAAPLQLNENLTEEALSEFLIQGLHFGHHPKFGERFQASLQKFNKVKQKLQQKWHQILRHPRLRKTPDLLITDVQLSATGESIMGADALAAIIPAYSGKTIDLTLIGTFKQRQTALPLDDFLFTLEAPLSQQTFIGREPTARILLDDAILLQIQESTETTLKARLEVGQAPDFYLKGLHKISVEQGDYYTDALIQVGDPEETDVTLQPTISNVEILRNQAGTPLHLRLTGTNFMVYPKFSYATIDGEFGFGFQTEATAPTENTPSTWETIVHIPNPETFDNNPEHLVVYSSPFGVAFKEFNGEGQ